jgi:hypothetical protein
MIFGLAPCASLPVDGRRHRRITEELGKPPEVLRGCGEQHLIPGAAQAAQPKSIEF